MHCCDGQNQTFVGQEINPHLVYKFLWDIATHKKIISIVNEIFSDNIALLATTLFTKYPESININDNNEGKYVGYHQDIRYWGLDPPKALNIWIAFDNVTMENGPMIYIPKTHKNGIYKHEFKQNPNNLLIGKQEISKDLFNENNAISVIMESGNIAIHLNHKSCMDCIAYMVNKSLSV